MPYHQHEIPKGEVGEFSKIKEECLELEDAVGQKNKIMVLIELSDLIGAIKLYVASYYGNISIKDLEKMADLTISCFEDGTRE